MTRHGRPRPHESGSDRLQSASICRGHRVQMPDPGAKRLQAAISHIPYRISLSVTHVIRLMGKLCTSTRRTRSRCH